MTEMFATNTVTVIGGDTGDGDTALSLSLYSYTPNNPSHVCVLDSLTWAYTNSSGDAQTLSLEIRPISSGIPLWQALVTVPAGECATIDKNFVHGMPIWKTSSTAVGNGTGEYKIENNAKNGSSITGTGTVTCATIVASVDTVPWQTNLGHGPGTLSVTYHMEPSSQRRY